MSEASLSPLTPVRYRPSLFSIDISSIGIKDTHQQLEYPFFSLSKRPDLKDRHYTDRHGNTLTVKCTSDGLPTLWDKDLLIFAISQIMAQRNRGEEASPTVRFHLADVIEFGQMTGGGATYRRLDKALHRLAGCTISTNIRTGDEVTTDIFHIIDKATIKRQYNRYDGRLEYCEFTLSDWLWRAVQANEVLTLHPDYFRLRQALARRIYEIARKHCGRQAEWQIALPLLQEKCGSRSKLYEFRRAIRNLSRNGDLLDYDMKLEQRFRGHDMVVFRRREGSLVSVNGGVDAIKLSKLVIPKAREILEDRGSVDAAEKDWRAWMKRKGVKPTNPEALFLSFCKTWAEAQDKGSSKADPNDKPAFRDPWATAWWEDLSEAERTHWRSRVGEKVELSNNEGWWRSEAAMARESFDLTYPFQHIDPEKARFPDTLLERLASDLAKLEDGPSIDELLNGWRHHLRTVDDTFRSINDPLMSLNLFAGNVQSGLESVRRSIQAASVAPAPAAPVSAWEELERDLRVDVQWPEDWQDPEEFFEALSMGEKEAFLAGLTEQEQLRFVRAASGACLEIFAILDKLG